VLLVLLAWSLQAKVRHSWVWALVGGLMVSYVSAMPMFTPLIGYMIVVGIARIFQRQIWQIPILAMFAATVLGTFLIQILDIVVLFISGRSIPFQDSFTFVTLPSALLNLLLALPIYALMTDVAKWVYPQKVEYE